MAFREHESKRVKILQFILKIKQYLNIELEKKKIAAEFNYDSCSSLYNAKIFRQKCGKISVAKLPEVMRNITEFS